MSVRLDHVIAGAEPELIERRFQRQRAGPSEACADYLQGHVRHRTFRARMALAAQSCIMLAQKGPNADAPGW